MAIKPLSKPISNIHEITIGSKPVDDGLLTLDATEKIELEANSPESKIFIRPYYGSAEYIKGKSRYCLWIQESKLEEAKKIDLIDERLEAVRGFRLSSKKALTRSDATHPHRFQEVRQTGEESTLIVPVVSSERRQYLPVGLLPEGVILSNSAFGLYDAALWNMSLVASKLHLVWISTVCGQLETRIRYSNTLGWNTFPVPNFTETNKFDLTRCAEDIMLAREEHFPATIADLYDPEKMPDNLRAAHERNDEVLERIYIGRRFKNDTERLEKLFELYTKMTAAKGAAKK